MDFRILRNMAIKLMCLMSLTIVTFGCDKTSIKSSDNMAVYSESPVTVQLGADNFLIPMNFLTPYGDKPSKIVAEDNIYVTVFLPDHSGYKVDDDIGGLPKINEVNVKWTRANEGSIYNAKSSLQSLLDTSLIKRDASLDKGELRAFSKKSDETRVLYYASVKNAYDLMIECSTNTLKKLCKSHLQLESTGVGIFYTMNAVHLESWRTTTNKIIDLMERWRVN